jgi:hypothetical protein
VALVYHSVADKQSDYSCSGGWRSVPTSRAPRHGRRAGQLQPCRFASTVFRKIFLPGKRPDIARTSGPWGSLILVFLVELASSFFDTVSDAA